jgi:hypothetical protein
MLRLDWSTTMEFSALFLAVTVVMVVAWWGTRTLALALFAATLLTSIATYLQRRAEAVVLSAP